MEPLYHTLCYLFIETSLEAEALLSFVSLLVTYSDYSKLSSPSSMYHKVGRLEVPKTATSFELSAEY